MHLEFTCYVLLGGLYKLKLLEFWDESLDLINDTDMKASIQVVAVQMSNFFV